MRIKFLHIYFFTLLSGMGVVQAQCPDGQSPLQISQPRVTGISGDIEYIPYNQFDPSLGTLIGVSVRGKVSGLIRMSVTNYNTNPRVFDVMVRRRDYFRSPGLGVNIILDTTVNYTTTPIPGADYPGTPPSYSDRMPNDDGSNINNRFINAPIDKVISQDITDPGILANYLGMGTVVLEYELNPGYMVDGSGSSQTVASITTYATNLELEVIYTYCPHAILPGGKLSFAANKGNGNNVLLTWTKEKETDGVQYTPEISKNGLDFVGIGTLQSQSPGNENGIAKYEYHYRVPVIDDNTKLYFRLKQTSPDGRVTYSEVTTLSYQNITERFTIYPNPAENNITLTFETPQRSNLNLSLINSMGQVVESENFHPGGATTHHYRFTRRHPPGVYFIRVVNAATRQQQVIRLMIK